MEVDIASLAAFVAIASVIGLTVWTEFRSDAEKRARVDRVRHHR